VTAAHHGWFAGLLGGQGGAVESVVVVVLVVAFLVYRQVVPRRLSTRALLLVPAVLLYFLLQALPSFHPSGETLGQIGVDVAVNLLLGLLAARQLRVYRSPETGKAMVGGSWTYFLWWLLAFAIKAGLAVAFGETGLSGMSDVEILIPVFLLVATRNAYLYRRATQLGLALH